jgi:hypothetical protein
MPNQYYVEPANVLPGIQALTSGAIRGAQYGQERDKEAATQEKLEKFAEAFPNMTKEAVGQFLMTNRDVADHINKSVSAAQKMSDAESLQQAWDVVTRPEEAGDILMARGDEILARGGDATETIALAVDAKQGGEQAQKRAFGKIASLDPQGLTAYMRATDPGATTPATDIDDYVADFKAQWRLDHDGKEPPPKKVNEARLAFKRAQAPEAAGVRGAVLDVEGEKLPGIAAGVAEAEAGVELKTAPQIAAETARAEETAKADVRLKKEPLITSAVADATAEAKARADEAKRVKTNQAAWDVYDTAIRNLTDKLSGTTTGPGMDWIPAVTANAQAAEGAIAAIAPVLKQLFRSAGEGIFTDKDQELLLRMIPTRRTLPAARDAQFRAIDGIVRAKLGVEAPAQPPSAAPGVIPTVNTQAEYDALPSRAFFIEDGKRYRKP